MKKQALLLSMLLASFNVNAFDISKARLTCDNLKPNATYQAVCVTGNNEDEDCRGYYVTEGFGQIKKMPNLLSNKPFFVKAADQKMSDILNCKYFNAYLVTSNSPTLKLYSIDANNQKVPYKVDSNVLHKQKGKLLITLTNLALMNKSLAQNAIDSIENAIDEHTNADFESVSDDKSQIIIEDITLAEVLMIKYLYQPQTFKYVFTDEALKQNIYFY